MNANSVITLTAELIERQLAGIKLARDEAEKIIRVYKTPLSKNL
jgi:hypothetical protein